ncbi:MAG: FHA domain-containing protein [Chitinophagaceae bacterium]
MKNILSRLKKGFMSEQGTITNEDPGTPAPAEHKSFMPATPALREAITGFIVQTLQPYVDEKAISVNGIHFYIVSNNREEEEAARVALYLDRPGMFKSEQLESKLLDHFIQLDPGWFFEAHIIKEQQLPDKCIRKLNFGLNVIRSGEQASDHCSKALVQVLTGQAEQSEYSLEPDKQLKFYIGRTRMPQLLSGKIQQNDIVFLGKEEQGFNELTGNPNLHVSRNHACIIYEPGTNHWLLYPDKGGLPENSNKIKVHTADDKVKWLNIYGVPHCLCDGDQVELGGEAVFRFRIIQA